MKTDQDPYTYNNTMMFYQNQQNQNQHPQQQQQQQQQHYQSSSMVDAYAQSVLTAYAAAAAASTEANNNFAPASASSSAPPDESLGAYVTSVLREQSASETEAEGSMDSLVELLQEHCSLSAFQANQALLVIESAVRTGKVPVHDNNNTAYYYSDNPQQQHFLSLQGLGQALPQVLSPLHEDKLILGDLMGALEEEEGGDGGETQTTTTRVGPPSLPFNEEEEDPFPPLGASTTKSLSSKKASKAGHKPAKSKKTAAANDLAAALFKPSSYRDGGGGGGGGGGNSNSSSGNIDEGKVALKSQQTQETTYDVTAAEDYGLQDFQPQHQQYPSQQQSYYYSTTGGTATDNSASTVPSAQLLNSAVEILLSLNADLSEEAAASAAQVAHADVNMAQYFIDRALSAPPICRHLLNDGCYRSDCQYSHDLNGHTCVFWLRGRCGKRAEGCKFLHGFDEEAAWKELEQHQYEYNHNNNNQEAPYAGYGSPDGYGMMMHNDQESNNNPYFGANAAAGAPPFQQQPLPPSSFVNIATQGYETSISFANSPSSGGAADFPALVPGTATTKQQQQQTRTVKIPLDLWTPHEARDSSAFHIADPLERYQYVSSLQGIHRPDVIDLHFQSTKTFPVVLSAVLPEALQQLDRVWIVTGTGHHVGNQTHQKGGGALENAVVQWLGEEGYVFARGKDRNGQGGAVLVENK